jgi:hypothetical protein
MQIVSRFCVCLEHRAGEQQYILAHESAFRRLMQRGPVEPLPISGGATHVAETSLRRQFTATRAGSIGRDHSGQAAMQWYLREAKKII